MKRSWMQRLLVGAAVLSLTTPVFAHHETGAAAGSANGLWHPLSGLDHLLALIAVGIWSAQQQGRTTYAMPVLFLAGLALGGVMATANVFLPLVEIGLALTVVLLGLMVVDSRRLPVFASAGLFTLFAVYHGQAHGAELVAGASAVTYSLGFLIMSAVVIAVSLLAARLSKTAVVPVYRFAGSAIALVGVMMLIGRI